MLNRIIIKDFFSFKGENEISLNQGLNLLLGINGSGKTSFINALRLLFEGMSENAKLEDLIQAQWGGFDQIANCTGKEKPDSIQITYVFDGESYVEKEYKSDSDLLEIEILNPSSYRIFLLRK